MSDKRSEKQKLNDSIREKNKIENATKAFNREKQKAENKALAENAQELKADRETKNSIEEIKKAAKKINPHTLSGNRIRSMISNIKYRQDTDKFNKRFEKYFKNKNIAIKKRTTARMNIMNIKGKRKGKNSLSALKQTLIHMLRVQQRQTDEWHPELTDLNLYYYDNQYYKHDEFVQIQNDIVDEIMKLKESDVLNRADKRNKTDIKKYTKLRASYRTKVKSLDKDDEHLQNLVNQLETGLAKDVKQSEHSTINNQIDQLQKYAFKVIDNQEIPDGRKAQKKNLVRSFIKHRETHLNKKSYDRVLKSENENVVSEVSFKIPHKNNDLGISQREYLDTVKDFFSKSPHLKNHDILTACTHFDEGKSKDRENITGANVHLIIDSKNKVTNKYCWRKSLIDFARSQQDKINKDFNMSFKIPDKTYNLSSKEICHVGQILQQSFYKHMQLNLFLDKGIKLDFVEEKDRFEEDYILNNLQQELAIQDRAANRFSMLQEEAAKQELKRDNAYKTMLEHEQRIEHLEKLETEKIDLLFKKIDSWQDKQTVNRERKNLAKNIAKDINKLGEQSPVLSEKIASSCVNYENSESLNEEYKISNHLNNNSNKKKSSKVKR